MVTKKKMLSNIIKTERFEAKMQEIDLETCQEKENNIKRRIRRISKETDITRILKS